MITIFNREILIVQINSESTVRLISSIYSTWVVGKHVMKNGSPNLQHCLKSYMKFCYGGIEIKQINEYLSPWKCEIQFKTSPFLLTHASEIS
jgi:hypothetical protein